MKKEIAIHARENSICDAHSPIRTFYLRTLRSPRKHSSENNDEILLHRRNIASETWHAFFLISIAASSRPRPRTTKTNNFYQQAKCMRRDFVSFFGIVYRKENAVSPKFFRKYLPYFGETS